MNAGAPPSTRGYPFPQTRVRLLRSVRGLFTGSANNADRPSALRAAQSALLSRSRFAISAFALLASLMLVGGGWNRQTGPLAVAGLVTLTALQVLFCRLAAHPRSSRGTALAGLAFGLVWSGLVLALLPGLGLQARTAIIVASSGLLGSFVLAASVLQVAMALAVPVAATTVAALASLHLSRPLAPILLAYPPSMLAVILCAHRVLGQQLRDGLRQQDRQDVAQSLLRDLQDTSDNWLWACNEEGRLTMLTEGLAKQIGLGRGDPPDVLLCNLVDRQRDTEGAARPLEAAFERREPFRDVVIPVDVGGRARWISISGKPVIDQGIFAGFQGAGSDVTEARANEARIAYLALNDNLTGLPNRAAFERRLDAACRAGWNVALLCVSLNDFSVINNTLGQGAGDQLMVAFAQRLRAAVRASDIVARIGGNEFGVLVEGLDHARVAELATRIAAEAGAPYRLADFDAEIASGAGVGVSFAPDDATDPSSLQRNASLALAGARREGIERPCFFDPAMLVELNEHRALLSDLRQALARGELTVCYHPIVDLFTGAVISAEALLRWHHPTRGSIPPSIFIPMAESSGLIVPIGRFVMAEATRQAASWREDMRVAVNVSPAQFRDEALLQSIDSAIAGSGLPATRLELEITESVLLEATRSTLGVLRGIRERGIRVALDDFGTGYSSLRYLRSFPFDKVKIDASFVRDMATDQEASAIVRAVIGLASSFGMKTTAEGVETEAQNEGLRAFGCTEGQGYLFSRVRDAPSMLEFVGARDM